MNKEKKIQVLQKKFNIPDKDLIAIGLKKEKTINETTRVSNNDKFLFTMLCIEKDSNASKYIRESIKEIFELNPIKQKELSKDIKALEKNKRYGDVDTCVPYVLNEDQQKDLKKFCKRHGILYLSSVARYIIVSTIEKEGSDMSDILS